MLERPGREDRRKHDCLKWRILKHAGGRARQTPSLKKSDCLGHSKQLWEATECHLVAIRENALCGSGSGGPSSAARSLWVQEKSQTPVEVSSVPQDLWLVCRMNGRFLNKKMKKRKTQKSHNKNK